MKPEIKKLWVEALRSGKYIKTTGVLRMSIMNKFCHCANGVLCDLYAKENNVDWKPRSNQYEGHRIIEYYLNLPQTDYQVIPQAVMEWAGLGTRDAKYNDTKDITKIHTNVEHLNDYGFNSFAHIADIIEKVEFV